jgi:mono/diheme cytochrome c family protein
MKLSWASCLVVTIFEVAALATTWAQQTHGSEGNHQSEVTFSSQIAPLFYNHCSRCHHPGGAGPFSLLSYEDAKRWGAVIEKVTQSRFMPPWLPQPGFGDFENNRRLPDSDLKLIQEWVKSGMPEGNPAEAPKPPVYAKEWELGPPDLILKVTAPMQVPASGPDLFRNFILPVPIAQTKYIRAMQIKPGVARVVHHANVIIDRTDSLRRQHPGDWQEGIPGMELTLDSGDAFDPDSHFLFWKPDNACSDRGSWNAVAYRPRQ